MARLRKSTSRNKCADLFKTMTLLSLEDRMIVDAKNQLKWNGMLAGKGIQEMDIVRRMWYGWYSRMFIMNKKRYKDATKRK